MRQAHTSYSGAALASLLVATLGGASCSPDEAALADESGSAAAAIIGGGYNVPAQWSAVGYMLWRRSGASEPPASLDQWHRCTGTLVAPNIVLTAAHCFYFPKDNSHSPCQLEPGTNPAEWEFGIGTYRATADRRFAVSKIILNPAWQSQQACSSAETTANHVLSDHDQALMILSSSVPSSLATPMGVAPPDAYLAQIYGGRQAWAVGYGRTSSASNVVRDYNVAERKYGSVWVSSRGTTRAVTVPGGATPYKGDSGGPLLLDPAGLPIIYGVFSRVPSDASLAVYSAFGNSSDYSWLHYAMGQHMKPTSRVAVASWSGSRLDLAVRKTDGQIWHRWTPGSGSGWMDYDPLGSPNNQPIKYEPALVSRFDGHLELFVIGSDNQMWRRWWTSAQGAWSPWTPMGGQFTSSPAVAAMHSGHMEVFARGTDWQLYRAWYYDHSGWSGWHSMGGWFTSGPAALAPNFAWRNGSNDGMQVFAFQNSTLLAKVYTPQTDWGGWTPVGNVAATTDPSAASVTPGELSVYFRGTDNQAYQYQWTSASGGYTLRALGGQLGTTPMSVRSLQWGQPAMSLFTTDLGLNTTWARTWLPAGWYPWTQF